MVWEMERGSWGYGLECVDVDGCCEATSGSDGSWPPRPMILP